jgi:hypothetical protein
MEVEINKMVIILEREIFKIFNEWVNTYPKLILILLEYAKCTLPKQKRIYKYIKKSRNLSSLFVTVDVIILLIG